MDTQRLLLIVTLGIISFFMWQTWVMEHQPPKPKTVETSTVAPVGGDQPPVANQAVASQSGDVVPLNPENSGTSSVPASVSQPVAGTLATTVKTDALSLDIDSQGNISGVKLLQYPIDIEHPDVPFTLLASDSRPQYVAQTGIRGINTTDAAVPGHNSNFTAAQPSYELGTSDTLEVPLVWNDAPSGVEVTKTYVFQRGSYVVTVRYDVKNTSGAIWKGSLYGQLRREGLMESEERGLTNYSYTGGVYYNTKEAYNKLDFDEFTNVDGTKRTLDLKGEKSWAGFIQHYFVGAVLTDPEQSTRLYTYQPRQHYVIGAFNPLKTVAPGEAASDSIRFFLGPKLQDKMEAAAEGLELTVDYGWLTFIAKPIFWLLKFIQSFVINWGVAIILITVLIKLAFFKLSETGYRSMANMRKLQPRLQSMKERYGDDKVKFQQAMMKLYKEEKVNPMGGCFPILVQIPVFIALYWVLLESVELRQASFLWLKDLSIKDPYFILPVIMGASMVIQQKLNPAPMEPLQQKLMMVLPIIFTVFFAFFPSGLVLYWVVNNVISIAQQWVITKRIAG
jgi:YidC/Oxa1 family membrane protein insertase